MVRIAPESSKKLEELVHVQSCHYIFFSDTQELAVEKDSEQIMDLLFSGFVSMSVEER